MHEGNQTLIHNLFPHVRFPNFGQHIEIIRNPHENGLGASTGLFRVYVGFADFDENVYRGIVKLSKWNSYWILRQLHQFIPSVSAHRTLVSYLGPTRGTRLFN